MISKFKFNYCSGKLSGFVTFSNPSTFVDHYNKFMGGVDFVDQSLNYYTSLRKARRGILKLSLHLIQIIMFNSYILNKKMLHRKKMCYHI